MANLNYSSLLYGAVLVSANIFALSVLPRTVGFTKVLPTFACVVGFVATAWALSRLVHSGMQLSILIPLAAAIIPLATIVVGIFLYGESASPQKISLLVVACGVIGFAARA